MKFNSLLIGFALLSGFCHALPAQEGPANATTEFDEIRGRVVDSSGKPIEKFSVTVHVYDYTEGGWNKPPKTLKKWEGDFENGEYRFDVDEQFPASNKVYIYSKLKAEGFLELGYDGYSPLDSFDGVFGIKTLSRGIKLKGIIALPDITSKEEKIAGGKLYVGRHLGNFMPDYDKSFNTHIKLNETGVFELLVPDNCNLILTASADNAATLQKTIRVPKGESTADVHDLGEIKLKEGVRVSGTVLDQAGKPVEGQIVQIRQNLSNQVFAQSTVYGYAVSDKEGKYELPPRVGKCDILLTDRGTQNRKPIKVKGKVLISKPVSISLKAGQAVEELEIRECASLRIYGVVNYKGDKPSMALSDGSNQQKNVPIDESGRFEIEVPEGIKPHIILYQNSSDSVIMAYLSRASQKAFGKHFSSSPGDESQFFQFKEVTTDIGPLEFTMVEHMPDNRSPLEQLFDWYYFGE